MSLPKPINSSIYQVLSEYRILTQAAQLNIAKGYTKYDDLLCYQASLDNRASEGIIKAMEKLKKAVRDNESVITEEMKQDLKKELGDVLWYLAVFADHLDIKLQDIADLNLQKLADRQRRNKLSGSGDNR